MTWEGVLFIGSIKPWFSILCGFPQKNILLKHIHDLYQVNDLHVQCVVPNSPIKEWIVLQPTTNICIIQQSIIPKNYWKDNCEQIPLNSSTPKCITNTVKRLSTWWKIVISARPKCLPVNVILFFWFFFSYTKNNLSYKISFLTKYRLSSIVNQTWYYNDTTQMCVY